jgi:LysM repeat protein
MGGRRLSITAARDPGRSLQSGAMPEPRIRRLHSRRARPGPGGVAPRSERPPADAPPAPAPEPLAGEAPTAAPEPLGGDSTTGAPPPAPPVAAPDERLAPEDAESAEAEAAVLAAGDVAEERDVAAGVAAAAAVAATEAPVEGEGLETGPAESAGEPAAEEPEPAPGPEAEGAAEPEAEEPAAEAAPAAEEPEPAAGPEPEAAAEGAEEPEGWFREAPLDEGQAVDVDLDGWPAVVTAAGADAEAPVGEAGVEPEETFVRERDRPVVAPLPAGEPPRRRSRLRQLLIGILTIVAVAVVGFVAGMMLPVIFPGPGIEPGSPSPAPTASSSPTPAPTATPEPTITAEPTVAPTPTPAPTATPEPTPLIHVVQPGDQLGRIAARYGVTVAAIVEANNLANPNLIRVGQRLIIPLPEATPAP